MINSRPVRILAGSYNGMYFEGSHFMTRKVIRSFQVGLAPYEPRVIISVFNSLGVQVYTAGQTSSDQHVYR